MAAGRLRLIYRAFAADFDTALRERYEPIARAVTAAMHRGGDEFKIEGRANIAAADGRFGRGWQGGWRVNVFPRRRPSVNAAIYGYHRIRYSGLFEEGGTVSGQPLLWIPFSGTPTTRGGRTLTAGRFHREVAPLKTIKGKSGVPLLGAAVTLPKNSSGRFGGGRRITLQRVRGISRRTGKALKGRRAIVPLYFGVSRATISKAFDLGGVAGSIAARIPGYYYQEFKDD